MEGIKGSEYKVRNRSNQSYALVKEETPLLEGVLKEDKEINLYYQERIDVQVNYLENETNVTLRSGTIIKSYVTEIIDVQALKIDGYILIGKETIHLVVTKENHHIEFKYVSEQEEI